MPYKRKGRTILVLKKKRWRVLKKHPSVAAAVRHLRALMANVPEARRK